MTAIPLPKVVELIRKLEPHMESASVDLFTLKRFKREAVDNLHVDPHSGYIALCMIALLEWDEEGMERAHRNAIAYRNDAFTHAHYANLLMLIGRFKHALEEMKIASEKDPANLSYLRQGVRCAKSAGDISGAISLIKLLAERAPGQDEELWEKTMNLSEVLERNGTNENVVAQCNTIAFGILRKNNLRFTKTRLYSDSQDDYAMFYIDIDADEGLIERLDEELGVALFDSVPDFHPDKYWIGYSKEQDNA